MSEEFLKWIEAQERVLIYRCLDTKDWYIEWFNDKGGYTYRHGPDFNKLAEEICT